MSEWYYHKGDRTFGPVQESSIRSWIDSGFLAHDDFVWKEGFSGWVEVSEFEASAPDSVASGEPARPSVPHSELPEPIRAKPTTHVQSVYAPFYWRAIALFIDSFILGILLALFFLDRLSGMTMVQILEDSVFNMASAIASVVYHALWEASNWQGSPGKRICRLRVADLDGQPLTLPRAVYRNLAKLVSGFFFGVGFLLALFTPRRQAFHDWVARCLVVRNL